MKKNKPKEMNKELLDKIISYFEIERNETIGYLAAEQLLEFFEKEIGKEIYKKAVLDILKTVKEKNSDLEIEISSLAELG